MINWVEFWFYLDSAFNFSAKASAPVPSSCGGKVSLDLAGSMRTFQNNSEHNFSNTCTPNLPDWKSENTVKIASKVTIFLNIEFLFWKDVVWEFYTCLADF